MVRKHSHVARPNRHAPQDAALPVGDEDDLLQIVSSTPAPLVLVLDGVQDPQNLGACLRTAAAAGVHALVAPKDRAAHLTETAARIACGGADVVPFIQVTNLARTLEQLQQAGLWLVGTADEAGVPLWEVDLRGPIALVLGAEGKGLRELTRTSCDRLVRIATAGPIASLNVSNAAAVALHLAAWRRRTV